MYSNIAKIGSALLAAALFLLPLSADVETTSGLKGNVNVPGATVEVVYSPTGLRKSTEVGENGNFSFSFLPVGGPYVVNVSADGYKSESVSDVYLVLSKVSDVNVSLVSLESLEDVVVSAKAGDGSLKAGTGTLLDRAAMDGIPTINRSVGDFAKMDPRVNVSGSGSRNINISVMGANNRYNDFSIDGISFNDPFGLNANGFGTMRNPISLDFVEQISVDVTPYDASRGNTTGGSIAVVTKSGSNEFDGSFFYTGRNEGNVGDLPGGDEFPEFSESTLAMTLSGPIIKDKLFFFFGYEDFEATKPALYGNADSGAPRAAEDVSAADEERIRSIAINKYGYDPGSLAANFPETQMSYVLKLDANLTDRQRASFNYSYSEDSLPVKGNYGNAVFSNNYYIKPPEIERMSVTLFSDWTDNFRTKVKYTSYEMVEDDASVGDSLFPEVRIDVGGDDVFLGGDRYRGANFINVTSDTFTFKGDLDLGDHFISFGVDMTEQSIYNLFISRYNGEIQFGSIDDFEAGTWKYLRFNTPLAGNSNVDSAAAIFDVEKTAWYIQDRVTVNDKLEVTLGARLDLQSTPDTPLTNPKFVERHGFTNATTFDFEVLQPRFSFNYDATDMFSDFGNVTEATLRGGKGLFVGRIPNVWWSNPYTRSGGLTDYNRFSSFSSTIGVMPAASVADPRFFWVGPTSNYQVRGAYFGDAQATDPNFKAPSSWRSNIGLDIATENGYFWTFEYNVDEVKYGVLYKDLTLEQIGTLADGRGVYDGDGDYLLTNGDSGSTEAWTVSVNKSVGDVKFLAAYTNMEALSEFDATSSQAESSYNYFSRYDGENYEKARSDFMVEHKFLGSMDYTTQLWGDNDTRFSLIYVRKSGRPYSVIYDSPGFNAISGPAYYSDNALAYIPTGKDDPKVMFTSDAVAEEVMNFINNGPLAAYKGKVAPRNAFNDPWTSRLDLRVTQDVALPEVVSMLGDNKLVLYFDVLNVLNFLDDENGLVYSHNYNQSKQIVLDGVEDGKVVIKGIDADDNYFARTGDGDSSWLMQFGFSWKF